EIGHSALETSEGLLVGMYYFFFSVNPLDLSSERQVLALPEVLLVIYMFPSLWRGVRRGWRSHRVQLFALVFIALAITFAYSAVTTNSGPLLRWRLQVVNVYVMLAALGWQQQISTVPARNAAIALRARLKRAALATATTPVR
ncbi:MAG TPA: hypothetical protein VML55_13650, partial [Planctomycetaceae bacterium]|nr:hypothetical protein [Planctomycetaceae bacterium]